MGCSRRKSVDNEGEKDGNDTKKAITMASSHHDNVYVCVVTVSSVLY